MDFGALRIEVCRGEKEKGRKVMHLRGLEFGPPDRNRTRYTSISGLISLKSPLGC